MSARPHSPRRFVVLGATGDLMERFLAPGLAELAAAGRLPERFELVGVGRRELGDDAFRRTMAEAVRGARHPARIVEHFRYARGDAADARFLADVAAGEPVILYAALPPKVMPDVVRAAADARLDPASAVVLEKPFGHDLASARALNALLADRFDAGRVFRVDHFLSIEGVQALRRARAETAPLEALLRREHVARVDVVWDETLALEGRAAYYDGAGALVDMVQNHLLQVLATLASELPERGDAESSARVKREILERVSVTGELVRARYGAGGIDGREVPAYVDEEGVDPDNETETFASVELRIDVERWRDVPFVLRSGKALSKDRREVHVALRTGGELAFSIDDAGTKMTPYAHVIDAVLRGDHRAFVSGPEAEASWRVVEPVLAAFREGRVPLRTYAAGTTP